MKKIGFLGCGKIGGTILSEISKREDVQITFIQDPFYKQETDIPVVDSCDAQLLQDTDLVIETATADILKQNMALYLEHADVMVFSVTAFSDEAFYNKTKELARKYGRRVYIPHGAIIGVDGIFAGRSIIDSVCIETTKNPKSLGHDADMPKTVLFDGSTREACALYPRNVNVHATIALAGIGFDKTHSRIIADPAVSTNTHVIKIEGEGIRFELMIQSFSTGGVTGKYTPYSAVASTESILGATELVFI